jgi:hypothetical protein
MFGYLERISLRSQVHRFDYLRRLDLFQDSRTAKGQDSGLIDLLLIGDIDQENLADLVRKIEQYIKRKLRALVLTPQEYRTLRTARDKRPQLLLWARGDLEPKSAVPGAPTVHFTSDLRAARSLERIS